VYSLEKEPPRSYIRAVDRVQEKYTSSNNKEDFIQFQLDKFAVALEVIERHRLTEEYKKKVSALQHTPAVEEGLISNEIQRPY
jgi:hypothetical protein